MTAQALADLHARAFAPERGWSAQEFMDLLAQPTIRLFTRDHGFALVRVAALEAELLTIAVAPEARNRGIGRALMAEWMQAVAASEAFLEVAQDNHAAMALYQAHGFSPAGMRPGYYARPGGPSVDAVLMRAALTLRHSGESTSPAPETG